MALTKADIIKSIHDQIDFPQNRSADIFESFLEIIKQSLANGEDIMISRFGKFCVNKKNKRNGRNPITGESLMITPKRLVTFMYSRKLKDNINKQ
ncbi:MAG: integration host factor subunit alpha [Syntrophobacterales bacterium]|nr:integration host factor subunit alpha [Syntrophobacterales bacterium]